MTELLGVLYPLLGPPDEEKEPRWDLLTVYSPVSVSGDMDREAGLVRSRSYTTKEEMSRPLPSNVVSKPGGNCRSNRCTVHLGPWGTGAGPDVPFTCRTSVIV